MLTFSSPPTEATLLPGLINVLNALPDNTAKEISPQDVRDTVYTLWHNSIIKPTLASNSNVKYIGLDQYQLIDSPSGNSIFPKMFFGKKQVGGQFIMNDNLLGTDTDFFFYNMKDNASVGNYNTTIAILSGTGTFLKNGNLAAPYLRSTLVSETGGNYMNLNIFNDSYIVSGLTEKGGDINLKSFRGYVSMNNFLFPKSSDITADKDGYVLKYKWISGQAYGVWESAFSQSITSINSSVQVTITGNPVVINGFNFTDANIVGTAIGGIAAGETFSNVSVMDMFRRIIYTYIPPQITASFKYTLTGAEQTIIETGDPAYSGNPGDSGKLRLYYTLIVTSTNSVTQISFETPAGGYVTDGSPIQDGGVASNSTDGFPNKPIARRGPVYQNKVFQKASLVLSAGEAYKYITYTFSVTDSYPTTKKVKAEIVSVLPYFYGTNANKFTTGNTINNILGTNEQASLGELNLKLVSPIIGTPTVSNNLSLPITTQGLANDIGYIYFGYPEQFPPLIGIKDNQGEVGNDVITAFTTYSVSISSRNNRWPAKPYRFYITTDFTGVPVSATNYKFLFATQS